MRLMEWLFPRGGRAGEADGDRACRRWKRAILLAVSDDLPEGSARALRRHLGKCRRCRADLARSTHLREMCLDVAVQRGPSRLGSDFWTEIYGAIESGSALLPPPEPMGWRGARVLEHRPLLLAASVSLAVLVLAALLFPLAFDAKRGSDAASRAVLDARWSQQWNEFVSGSEARGDLLLDPFAAELPNPEVIDF